MRTSIPLRVVISGGGTAGHIYPALAVAHVLRATPPEPARVAPAAEPAVVGQSLAPGDPAAGAPLHAPFQETPARSGWQGNAPDEPPRPGVSSSVVPSPGVSSSAEAPWPPAEVLYLHGPSRIDEEVLAHSGIAHRRLAAGPIRGAAPHRLGMNVLRQVRATVQAYLALAKFRPHVVLATGGYVSAPAILAARLRGVPVVLYLPDAEPGLAVRAFAPLAQRIALSFPVTKRYFKRRQVIVTGYPVRPEFLSARHIEGRHTFGLASDLPVVMVMGGSTGAHSINLAVQDVLEPLLHHTQVIHLSGDLDEPRLRERRAALDPQIRTRYHLFRYLHRGVAEAMAASDLIVCRAGASAMAELPLLRLPGILVPHPYGHQDANADFLVQQGAAVKLRDHDLAGGALLTTILSLLEDRPRLERMAAEMGRLARPEAADNIAALLRAAAGWRERIA